MRDWNDLVKHERVAELGPPTAADIAQRIQLARLAVEESGIPGLRPGRRFQILYEAAYRWSEIVPRSEGWRTKGQGHHEALFSSLPHFLGESAGKIARCLDNCRTKLNLITYGIDLSPVTDCEVEELAKIVQDLESIVLAWLREKHPQLAPL